MTPERSERPVQFESVFEEEISCIKTSRESRDVPADEHHLKESLVGLAFSGGGIRSATFNLGILQAFAKHRILHQFDYLSTVSGGGYIGSWLAALTKRLVGTSSDKKFHHLEDALIPEQYTPERRGERSFLHWLRLYSNYLTPHKGLLSGDTWAMVSTWIRNTALNQAIFFLFWASLFLFCQSLLVTLVRPRNTFALVVSCVVAVALSGLTMGLNVMKRDPQRRTMPRRFEMLATIVWPLVASLLLNAVLWQQHGQAESLRIWVIWGLAGGAYYLVPSILALLFEAAAIGPRDHKSTTHGVASRVSIAALLFCSLVAGVAGGCAAKAYGFLLRYVDNTIPLQWVVVVMGTGVIMEIMIHAGILRQGLTGRAVDDLVRERWARVGGYITLTMLGWILFASACAFGPLLVRWSMAKWVAGTSGFVVWLVGTLTGLKAAQSAKTAGDTLKNLASAIVQPEKKRGLFEKLRSPRVLNVLAKTAPYIFAVGLLLVLSCCVQIVAGLFFARAQTAELWWRQLGDATPDYSLYWVIQHQGNAGTLAGWGVVLLAATCLLSWRVDINEFSMHHFYRNRLVRCYLGASNPERNPQPFTGFAPEDDPPLEEFANGYPGPYPILNASLNITDGRELGYGTRRAKSFIFTPLYCGYERNLPGRGKDLFLASNLRGPTFWDTFSPTALGRTRGLLGRLRLEKKITLGTALAISGAALSPNMGYHSSPATALLMTLFDVRLGWWMGNPRSTRNWTSPGPRLGLGYLFLELLGQADQDKGYVYLSDGGHFENLGVYELIRRKCRLIVASDVGCDGDFCFDDLRALVEKARLDFGARIVVDYDAICPPQGQKTTSRSFVEGTIYYDPQNPFDKGIFLYIKACLPERTAHRIRTEASLPDDVWRYAEKHPAFPHESTADQWFDEWQFESYRALGEHIGDAAADSIERCIGEVAGLLTVA